jgi:hypothetical protein
MGKDIRIYPSQSQVLFSGSDNSVLASITTDNMGNLILSASNDVLFGPGKNDIYIGDGTQSANIIFDIAGAIKSAPGSGATITLGSTDTPIVITGSTIDIAGSNLEIGTFTSSFAKINAGSITASLSSSFAYTTILSASNINSTNAFINDITASTLTLLQNEGIYFNYSSSVSGGAIFLDNLGNIVIDSKSGSVYLSKNKHDIYIGDGTSSADIVFDYDGAIRGENGQNVALTIGSPTTRLTITGSTLNIGTFTSSFAQINNSNITASFISSSGFISASSLSSNIIITNTGSFAYFTSSNILLNPNGGIFITSSDGTKGGSIYLDNLGNLQFTSVSGSVFLGKGTGDIYIGDGTSSANIIFDQGGAIKAGDSITLNIGSPASFIEATGSSITFQRGGGDVTFGGNIVNTGSVIGSRLTGSFTGSFVGNGSGLTNLIISSSITSGSFTGSFGGTGSLRLETGSVGISLNVSSDFLRFSSGSITNLAAQQVTGTTSMSFAFNTSSAIGGQGATFDVRATAVIMNPQGNFFSENLRLPAAPNGYSAIIMGGPVTGSSTQPGVWTIATSPSSSATGSNLRISHFLTDVINVYTSSLVQITSPSGAILRPTASAIPAFNGSDGQFLFGNVGGNQVMFVWMAGRWRSSSLS